MADLKKEIKQKVAFSSLQEEVMLNMTFTYSLLTLGHESLFKDYGITANQYNVLRILRGAGKEGLPSSEIKARMVTRIPDVTRLVDRLLREELVVRERCESDRRVVYVKITRAGEKLLAALDKPVVAQNKELFPALNKKELLQLNYLLEKAREI